MDPILENINSTVDQHTLLKLREIAEKYNALPIGKFQYQTGLLPVEKMVSRSKCSTIPYHETKEEYICQLWRRLVKIPEVLTFGEPYDSFLPIFATSTWDDDTEDATLTLPSLEGCELYQVLTLNKYAAFYMTTVILENKNQVLKRIRGEKAISPITKAWFEKYIDNNDRTKVKEGFKSMSVLDITVVYFDLSDMGLLNQYFYRNLDMIL